MRGPAFWVFVLLLHVSGGVDAAPRGWSTPPSMRLILGLHADHATAVSVEGTPYGVSSGGIGAGAGVWLDVLGPVQLFLDANLFAGPPIFERPCRNSPFDPDTLICEATGAPIRVLGATRAGLRFVPRSDDGPSRLGITLGAQYFVQSLYSTQPATLFEPILPYVQVDWAADEWLFSAAAGFGGYVALEVATTEHPLPLDHLVLRVERLDLAPTGPAIGDVAVFLLVGVLDSL